ncbi:MAG: aspartyl protease family protein, partial [candidate division Zixibacteria bacterium]|nr:aspartyl protease family protein [candidate division Zixibacteria bacterium]
MKSRINTLLLGLVFAAAVGMLGLAESPKPLTIPFTLDRNRIIIPTTVNGSRPLRLILDTGMRFDGIYLFHREALRLIDTAGAMEVRVPGAGGGEASSATMIETGRIGFGEVSVADQRILVAHSAHTQSFPTDGVIGWNLFGHYVVEIDYDRQCIFLRDSSYVPSDSGWVEVPVRMKQDLPFLEVSGEVIGGDQVVLQ